MNQPELKYLAQLQKILETEVGFKRTFNSLVHLNKYLEKCRDNRVKEWRGIPINFAIRYTKPVQPEFDRKRKLKKPIKMKFA